MRTLADPTRRAVFERVASCDEITVVALKRGSGVTQGAISQHLKSLKQAGSVAERPEGRNVTTAPNPRASRRWSTGWATMPLFWRDRVANLRTLLKEIDP